VRRRHRDRNRAGPNRQARRARGHRWLAQQSERRHVRQRGVRVPRGREAHRHAGLRMSEHPRGDDALQRPMRRRSGRGRAAQAVARGNVPRRSRDAVDARGCAPPRVDGRRLVVAHCATSAHPKDELRGMVGQVRGHAGGGRRGKPEVRPIGGVRVSARSMVGAQRRHSQNSC